MRVLKSCSDGRKDAAFSPRLPYPHTFGRCHGMFSWIHDGFGTLVECVVVWFL